MRFNLDPSWTWRRPLPTAINAPSPPSSLPTSQSQLPSSHRFQSPEFCFDMAAKIYIVWAPQPFPFSAFFFLSPGGSGSTDVRWENGIVVVVWGEGGGGWSAKDVFLGSFFWLFPSPLFFVEGCVFLNQQCATARVLRLYYDIYRFLNSLVDEFVGLLVEHSLLHQKLCRSYFFFLVHDGVC